MVYTPEMFNCTIVNHSEDRSAIVVGVNAQSKIWNNVFWNPDAATNWYAVATNAGCNSSNDPAFIPGTYRLSPGSPCIDAGNDSYVVGSLDFYGRVRQRGTVDIGAVEFQPETDALPSPSSCKRRFLFLLGGSR